MEIIFNYCWFDPNSFEFTKTDSITLNFLSNAVFSVVFLIFVQVMGPKTYKHLLQLKCCLFLYEHVQEEVLGFWLACILWANWTKFAFRLALHTGSESASLSSPNAFFIFLEKWSLSLGYQLLYDCAAQWLNWNKIVPFAQLLYGGQSRWF